MQVALLAEGVDRNSGEMILRSINHKSPSSQRAWIEIWTARKTYGATLVALLAEGVDRNHTQGNYHTAVSEVALLAEGVDRN